MSNYIEQYFRYGSKMMENKSNGVKVNVGTSAKPLNIMFISSPPHNVVTGDMYFDTTRQTLRMYDGNKWVDVEDSKIDHNLIDEFDIIAVDIGFVKVKLYQDILSGKRGVLIQNDDMLIDDTEEAIKFIREKLTESYLFVEKRIMDHLA